MITCSRCSKENQDHYKFCLGCGAKLERPSAVADVAPKEERAEAPSQPVAQVPKPVAYTPPPAQPLAYTPSPAALVSGPMALGNTVPPQSGEFKASQHSDPDSGMQCPECGHGITPSNTFCGKCGLRLRKPSNMPETTEAGFVEGNTSGKAPMAPLASQSGGVPKTMFMAGGAGAPQPAGPRGHMTLIRPDGSEGGVHPIAGGETLIGRGQGPLFDADPYLSPRHAELQLNGHGLVVRDLKSLNGVFLKVTGEEALDSGSIFRIGQELLRFDVIEQPLPLEDGTEVVGTPNPGYWGRISVIVGRDVDGPAFPIFEESIVLGRERGDILFPEDGYVSATHARISLRDGHVYLQDLGSSNGSFIRLNSAREIPSGCLLLMGQQLFRIQFQ